MIIRHVRSFGAARIDHDQRAVRVGRNVAQNRTRALKAMRLPWILTDENRGLGLLVAAAEAGPEKLMVHPKLAGLFLRQRVGAEHGTERAPSGSTVTAAQMIALAAAAVIEDARAAVGVAHPFEACGNLANRGVPVDFLEGAVGTPPQRRSQPITAVLVIVNPLRFLAGIALRRDVIAISAHASDMTPVELHFDPAVHAAQNANGLLPVVAHNRPS